jgi:hypothetical protein
MTACQKTRLAWKTIRDLQQNTSKKGSRIKMDDCSGNPTKDPGWWGKKPEI